MSYTSSQIYSIIQNTATQDGVNPNLALADAQVESNFNPYAVGDGGTSFGLYQLHQGGELGNLTPTQAFNPSTNAGIALAQFAKVQQAEPWITDPGQIAAAAQRPAHPNQYALQVDKAFNNINAGHLPSNQTFHLTSTGSFGLSSASGGAGSGFTWWNPLSWGNAWGYVERGLVVILGVGLILLGVYMLFSGKSASETVVQVGNTVKKGVSDGVEVGAET